MYEYLNRLNPRQKEAATTIEGPELILAAAGTGKTTVLIARVAYLIDQGVNPKSILLLTFTKKAAEEMKYRAQAMSDERCGQIEACTYHAFCSSLLRRYGYHIDIAHDFTILTSQEACDAVQFAKAAHEEKYNKRGFPSKKTIQKIFSAAINKEMKISEVVEAEHYTKVSSFIPELESLFTDFMSYKKEHNLLDYDDLLLYTYQLLSEDENVRKKVERQYKYIMVDEYQDTNPLQDKIISMIRKDNLNLAVVGDDFQAIYGFRGSDVQNILNFEENWPGCKTVIIDTNYRSNEEILRLANDVIDAHATEGFQKKMIGTYFAGRKPVVVEPSDAFTEADYILSKIKHFHEEGVHYHDIAVLMRGSNDSNILEAKLTQENIPFEKRGGLKFFDYECVQDVLAYLKVVTNPADELGWFRVLKLHPGIGDKYAKDLVSKCKTDRDFLLDDKYKRYKWHKECHILYDEYQKISGMSSFKDQLDEIISFRHDLRERVIKNATYHDEGDRTKDLEQNEAELTTLESLKEMANEYESAVKFLDSIILDDVEAPVDGDNLILSTIHSAKGLEFKVVFILDCIEDVFPKHVPYEGSPEDNEELRCFYVALTRAKEYLYIMCPEELIRYGKYIPGEMTHYLEDVDRYEISKDYTLECAS